MDTKSLMLPIKIVKYKASVNHIQPNLIYNSKFKIILVGTPCVQMKTLKLEKLFLLIECFFLQNGAYKQKRGSSRLYLIWINSFIQSKSCAVSDNKNTLILPLNMTKK